MTAPRIVWFRRDLRLADQAALSAAAQSGPIMPVYVLDDARAGDHALGGASRWWLHHSLDSLGRDLAEMGARLVLRRGDAVHEIARLAEETGAAGVHAIRHYEPWWKQAEALLAGKLELELYDGNYLSPPGSVRTGSGGLYKVYTPFARALSAQMPPHEPLPAPRTLAAPSEPSKSDRLSDWGLLPTRPDWSSGIADFWRVGERAAHARLAEWTDEVGGYTDGRNLPSQDGSSRLSPHLHWGELSPAQVWYRLAGGRSAGWKTFAGELMWRDYAQNVVDQFPDYATRSYRDGYQGLWRTGTAAKRDLSAWQRGQTGYPIVDAGMRQLWQTGWMHNRVRMITASFLVKHLLVDWREGERWFWDCLVDADYGNNAVNWQWVAGTGVDSNMFVRIMAPLVQSEKFAAAAYIREYVPELAHLPDDQIHDPDEELRGDYPARLIGHREARERALAAYRDSKG